MDWGLIASIVLGIGVAGHAVVGVVLTTPLAGRTKVLWARFGDQPRLLRLNGSLLVIAAGLHLVVSLWKVWGLTGAMFWSSIATFPAFAAAGVLEATQRTGWVHHACMAAGWLLFLWHGLVN